MVSMKSPNASRARAQRAFIRVFEGLAGPITLGLAQQSPVVIDWNRNDYRAICFSCDVMFVHFTVSFLCSSPARESAGGFVVAFHECSYTCLATRTGNAHSHSAFCSRPACSSVDWIL